MVRVAAATVVGAAVAGTVAGTVAASGLRVVTGAVVGGSELSARVGTGVDTVVNGTGFIATGPSGGVVVVVVDVGAASTAAVSGAVSGITGGDVMCTRSC